MKNLILSSVFVLIASSAAQAQQAVQWRVQDGGNGHWYRLQNDGGTWQQARLTAELLGGHLATITSADENAFVWQILSTSTFYPCFAMLGGYQDLTAPDYVEPAGGWRWVTGEEFVFTAWYSIEPNDAGAEHFLAFREFNCSGTWNDIPDDYSSSDTYVVEWSADCNQDGIVDYGQILQGQLQDTNADGIPDICQVPTCVDADLFRDFNVNGADLGILLSQWGPNTPLTESDLNHDGVVNGADLGIFLGFWGPCPN